MNPERHCQTESCRSRSKKCTHPLKQQRPLEPKLDPQVTEENWLLDAKYFIESTLYLHTEPSQSVKICENLENKVIQCIKSALPSGSNGNGSQRATLPLNYRFLTLAELRLDHTTPVCSHYGWSTSQFTKWTNEGKRLLTEETEFPLKHLLLFGYLTDHRQEECISKALPDWHLYIRDNTGVIPCELLEFSPAWLGQLFFFPSWSYVPSQDTQTDSGGYLEIYAAPIPVTPQPPGEPVGEPEIIAALHPEAAIQLLSERSVRWRKKFSLVGELCRVSSVLYIGERALFFLFIKDFSSDACVTVMVQNTKKLCWIHALRTGSCYIITKLQVATVKPSRCRVVLVGSSSELRLFNENRMMIQEPERLLCPKTLLGNEVSLPTSVESSLQSNTQDCSSLELLVEECASEVQTSKMLTYKGTITKVLNGPAGLYELDGSICLCVAYLQTLNNGRALRSGAHIEVQDVHLQQRPSEHFPLVLLCCCLRSIVRVTDFSRLWNQYQPFNEFVNIYRHLLAKYHLDLPWYLWMVHAIEALLHKFCPKFMEELDLLAYSDLPGIVEKCLGPVLALSPPTSNEDRNIEQEIMDEQHWCPLVKYHSLKSTCHIPLLSEVVSTALQKSWEELPISAVIPESEVCYMTTGELNRSLAWSFHTFLPSDFQSRPVLVGVLRPCSRSGFLQLQDQTGCLPCKVLGRPDGDGRQFWQTHILGCIVRVEKYQLVVERFTQSDFPSWEQLQSTSYIREKQSRVYIQFFFNEAQILDDPTSLPHSVPTDPIIAAEEETDGLLHSMTNNQGKDQRTESSAGAPVAKLARLENVETEPIQSRLITKATVPHLSNVQPCVTRLLMVLRKEGLMLRNCQVTQQANSLSTLQQKDGHTAQHKAELQLSFYALCAWVGKPCLCTDLPDSIHTMLEIEAAERDWDENTVFQKVKLMFTGKAIKWNDVLHTDGLYRIIAPQESTLCVDRPSKPRHIYADFLVNHLTHTSEQNLANPVNAFQDMGVFDCCSVSSIPRSTQHKAGCPLSLHVQDKWRWHFVTSLSSIAQHQNVHAALDSMRPKDFPLAKILSPRKSNVTINPEFPLPSVKGSLVSFRCKVLRRIVCEPDTNRKVDGAHRARQAHSSFLPWDLSIKLLVKDLSDPSCLLDLYMDSPLAPLPFGLLPGAKVHFHNVDRIISRAKKVYCRYLVCSSFTILGFGSGEQQKLPISQPEVPSNLSSSMLQFFRLMSKSETSGKGHNVCQVTSVIDLSLCWVCSLCTSTFKQGRCSQNSSPPCPSLSGVFQASAKIMVEDATAESLVQCKNQQVGTLLRLNLLQWEGLQQYVLRLGEVRVQPWCRSAENRVEEVTDDFFVHFLRTLCTSENVCRPILLTFEPQRRVAQNVKSDSRQMRRFTQGDQEYVTTMLPQLSLICLDLQEVDYRMLARSCCNEIEQNMSS